MRSITIVECYSDFLARSFNSIDNGFTSHFIDGHWFLRDDITSQLKRSDDVDIVCTVHSRDDYFVWFCFCNHLVEVLGLVCWDWC